MRDYAEAARFRRDYVEHYDLGNYFHVFQGGNFLHQLRGYLLARAVLVKENSVSRMSALARCRKPAVGRSRELHAEFDKSVGDLSEPRIMHSTAAGLFSP